MSYNPIPIKMAQALELLQKGWALYANPEYGGIATLYSPEGDMQSVRLNVPALLLKKGLIVPSEEAKQIVLARSPKTIEPEARYYSFNPPQTEGFNFKLYEMGTNPVKNIKKLLSQFSDLYAQYQQAITANSPGYDKEKYFEKIRNIEGNITWILSKLRQEIPNIRDWIDTKPLQNLLANYGQLNNMDKVQNSIQQALAGLDQPKPDEPMSGALDGLIDLNHSGFKEWLKLQEVGTGTNSIAVFARPVMPVVRRGCKKKNGECGLADY